MINRYLGNKTVLLEDILGAVARFADPGDLVCDVFSGSLSVSLALKRAGYRVAANDVNRFSGVLGRAFIANNTVPPVSLTAFVQSPHAAQRLRREAEVIIADRPVVDGWNYLREPEHADHAADLLALLLYLERQTQTDGGVRREFARQDFFDHYCEEGEKSAFTSSRGRTGRRRFFSSANARHLDSVVNRLRQWRADGLLAESLDAVVLSVLIGAVERVSNTQGTYHDFPRDTYDPRALKPMRLMMPAFDGLLGSDSNHVIGNGLDSLEFIGTVPEHAVLYIDPPYNFRQYTAYYFLPNVICRYPSLTDPAAYFDGIQYVRGQNPEDDFVSSFCKAKEFLPSLRTLIERADTETVVLSYFDGRNHWNDFKAEPNGEGFSRVSDFFRDDLFAEGSLEVHPVARMNYQSYGGYKAREVNEYLFIASKR